MVQGGIAIYLFGIPYSLNLPMWFRNIMFILEIMGKVAKLYIIFIIRSAKGQLNE